MNLDAKIFVAGAYGMVGSSIIRKLKEKKFKNIFYTKRKDLDFSNQSAVNDYFKSNKYDQIYIAAAKVGGIKANNDNPVEFLQENLLIQTNLISAAFTNKILKVLFLGSSCIYPKFSEQPIKEEYLLNGPLETTNEAYALAKITGIKLCEAYNQKSSINNLEYEFKSLMPCNLYGVGDNYNYKESHVIPALISKFHKAKILKQPKVNVWGSGVARREFLYVDDLAEASILFLNTSIKEIYKKLPSYKTYINVGSGEEVSIKELSEIISSIVNYKGDIIFDISQHEGVQRKLLDSTLIKKLNWSHKINLREGIKLSYNDYLARVIKS